MSNQWLLFDLPDEARPQILKLQGLQQVKFAYSKSILTNYALKRQILYKVFLIGSQKLYKERFYG